MTHFLRYTCVTLPSRPLYFPRTIRTSSSFRTASDRACFAVTCQCMNALHGTWLTLCLLRNSFDSDEVMILRRIEEGAEKCSLRDLRREEETSVKIRNQQHHPENKHSCSANQDHHIRAAKRPSTLISQYYRRISSTMIRKIHP